MVRLSPDRRPNSGCVSRPWEIFREWIKYSVCGVIKDSIWIKEAFKKKWRDDGIRNFRFRGRD